MKYVTTKMLERMDACFGQRVRFESIFGQKMELTKANVEKAFQANLDVVWFIRKRRETKSKFNLLSGWSEGA